MQNRRFVVALKQDLRKVTTLLASLKTRAALEACRKDLKTTGMSTKAKAFAEEAGKRGANLTRKADPGRQPRELNGSTGGDHAELIKLKRCNTCRYRAAPRDMPSRQT
jgi:hypothetical protein